MGHKISEKEAALTIWEVDDDNDGAVDWDEFRTMYYRVRNDDSGCEPRKLFNVVDFLMLDKNHSGSVDMDEEGFLTDVATGLPLEGEELAELAPALQMAARARIARVRIAIIADETKAIATFADISAIFITAALSANRPGHGCLRRPLSP